MPTYSKNSSEYVLNTVELLRKEVKKHKGEALPSLRSMAKSFGVSIGTLSTAAKILREKGVIEYSKGRKIRAVIPQNLTVPLKKMTANDRVCGELISSFETIEFESGAELPKVSVLTQRYHTSATTLLEVFRKLELQGLMHKKGKRWIAGPASIKKGIQKNVLLSDTILVLLDREAAWTSMYSMSRLADFARSFCAEADKRGVRIYSVFTNPEEAPLGAKYTCMNSIGNFIKSLGSVYRGTLIVPNKKRLPKVEQWIHFLTRFDKPVAWFDRENENLERRVSKKSFARFYMNEESAVDVAVESIIQAGHKSVYFPVSNFKKGNVSWIKKRLSILQASCRKIGLDLIQIHEQIPNHFVGEGSPSQRRTRAYSPLMEKILSCKKAKAIISPYDYNSYHFYHWLIEKGYRIPQDYSLIGFDNSPSIRGKPINTIDFGFSQLGYSAFHWLYRDFPVKRDRNGDVSARPYLIDNGSVAA